MQCVYRQNEGYVKKGRVLNALDFVKQIDGRFSGKEEHQNGEKKEGFFSVREID